MGTKFNDEALASILKKTNQKEEELASSKITLEEIESFGDSTSIKKMFTNIAKYNKMMQERIVFVNQSLTAAVPFTRENLYLICAYTGSGKSTIAANISYPLWKQGKKTLVISNEEPEQDVVFRIACLELGYNFNDFKKGMMTPSQQKECAVLFQEISKYVKVLDVNYKDGATKKLEAIKAALMAVKDSTYSCAMIDYYQLIQYSIEDKTRSRYDVLNDLRIWLGQYIRNANIPIVLFAQLHSIGKRNNKDLDSRIKECPTVLEPSTVVIEVIPNFEDKTSEFIIHKDRFGLAGHKITCGFDKGRYVNMSEEFKRAIAERKLDELQAGPREDEDDLDEEMPSMQQG